MNETEQAAESGQAPTAGEPRVACLTLPGRASQVREARRWLARQLADFPAADEALLAMSELAANAVTHSGSQSDGGTFTVRIAIGADLVRIEVADSGGPWRTGPGDDDQRGRGLLIVAAVAIASGITGDQAGRTAWCEISATAALPDARPGQA